MKFNFKKISAIAGSVLMAGLTLGVASAASFPAPFVEDGKADVAVVYGANANLDMAAAGNVQTALGTYVEGTTTVEGGESFTLDKSSDHFNFNNALNSVYSDLDEEQMDFLADGTYDDGDVDETYEQKITLGSKTLALFADNDYNNDDPTVGFRWTNGETILSYTIDFDDTINYTQMVDTDMPLFGKEYYVLAASSTQIDILDSAEKTVISEGETVTVGGKTVSIEFIDSDEVKFNVDGELTNKLQDHEYEELSDGSYIVANEVLYSTKEGTVGKAEFSIGAGKMELISGEEIELNDEDIDGLESTLTTSSSKLDSITITWKSDRETYLTEEDAIVMPGFEAVQLSFGGLEMPSESETISLDNGETFTINMDNYDLPLAWVNSTAAYFGEEDYELVLATSTATNTTWTSPARTANLTGGLDLEENDRFLVTLIGTDLTDIETMYYEVTTVENDSGTIEVVLDDLISDNDLTFDELETHDRSSITVNLTAVNGSVSGARAYLKFTESQSGTLYYNKVVSDKGMVITLPTDASYFTNGTGATLTFTEADKDEDLTEGRAFTATVKNTTNTRLHVSTHNLTAYDEEESDNKFIGYVPSDLASKIMFDTSADEYDFSVEYYAKEVTADVMVVAGDATVSTDGALGDILVKDSEINSVMSKNLVIVGGSCINSAAATVLGGAYCGEMFTQMTGVSAGEFLIKGVEDAYTTGKLALVVAGYEAADTANAVTYLTKKDVDTMKSYKGTSATEATMLVE